MQTSCKQTARYQDKMMRAVEALPDAPVMLFSPFEDDLIRKYYRAKGARGMASVLGKTHNQIMRRANRLGLRRKGYVAK